MHVFLGCLKSLPRHVRQMFLHLWGYVTLSLVAFVAIWLVVVGCFFAAMVLFAAPAVKQITADHPDSNDEITLAFVLGTLFVGVLVFGPLVKFSSNDVYEDVFDWFGEEWSYHLGNLRDRVLPLVSGWQSGFMHHARRASVSARNKTVRIRARLKRVFSDHARWHASLLCGIISMMVAVWYGLVRYGNLITPSSTTVSEKVTTAVWIVAYAFAAWLAGTFAGLILVNMFRRLKKYPVRIRARFHRKESERGATMAAQSDNQAANPAPTPDSTDEMADFMRSKARENVTTAGQSQRLSLTSINNTLDTKRGEKQQLLEERAEIERAAEKALSALDEELDQVETDIEDLEHKRAELTGEVSHHDTPGGFSFKRDTRKSKKSGEHHRTVKQRLSGN